MSTLSKVLLGLVTVASIGLAYLGVRAYGTLSHYGSNYQEHIDEIAKQDVRLAALRPELAELKSQMEQAVSQRGSGRLWYGDGSVAEDGTVKVTVVGQSLPPSNDENQAEQASPVYVYETWGPEGMPEDAESSVLNYLGQFLVTFTDPQVTEDNVTLTPALALSGEQQQTLEASVDRDGVRWIMYEEMPADSYAILEDIKSDPNFTPESFAAMFPSADDVNAASIASMLHHGEAADQNDPDDRIMVSVKFTKNFDELTPAEVQYLRDSLPLSDGEKDDEFEQVDFENYIQIEYEQLVRKDEYVRMSRAISELLTNPVNMQPFAVVESPVDEAGNAEPERMFMRPLRDFELIFRRGEQNLVAIASRIEAIDYDLTKLRASIDVLTADVERVETLLAETKADRDHYQEERDLAQNTVTELEAKEAEMDAKVSELLAENARMAEELRQAQIAEAQAINNRVGTQAKPASLPK